MPRRQCPPISGPSAKRANWTERSNTRTGSPPIHVLTSTSPTGRTTGFRCGATDHGRGVQGVQRPFSWNGNEGFRNMHEHSEVNGAQIMRKEGGAMKRLLLFGVGSALMFTMGGVGPAQADTNGTGSIHKSTAAAAGTTQLVSVGGGRGAGCHRAHTAKAVNLLQQTQPALCYTCHGGAGSTLDVVDGVDPQGATPTALRGGGFAYSLINGAGATMTVSAVDQTTGKSTKSATDPVSKTGLAPVTSRNQIDGVTTGTIWGNGAISATVGDPLAAGKTGVTLECGSCHDPHGNGNYRLL